MAIAIVVPNDCEVGSIIKITGTGFTVSDNVLITAFAEDSRGGLELRAGVVVTSISGEFDTTGVLDFAPNEEGHINITVTDVTADTSEVARIQVLAVG